MRCRFRRRISSLRGDGLCTFGQLWAPAGQLRPPLFGDRLLFAIEANCVSFASSFAASFRFSLFLAPPAPSLSLCALFPPSFSRALPISPTPFVPSRSDAPLARRSTRRFCRNSLAGARASAAATGGASRSRRLPFETPSRRRFSLDRVKPSGPRPPPWSAARSTRRSPRRRRRQVQGFAASFAACSDAHKWRGSGDEDDIPARARCRRSDYAGGRGRRAARAGRVPAARPRAHRERPHRRVCATRYRVDASTHWRMRIVCARATVCPPQRSAPRQLRVGRHRLPGALRGAAGRKSASLARAGWREKKKRSRVPPTFLAEGCGATARAPSRPRRKVVGGRAGAGREEANAVQRGPRPDLARERRSRRVHRSNRSRSYSLRCSRRW